VSGEVDVPQIEAGIGYFKKAGAGQVMKNAVTVRNKDLIKIKRLIRWKDEIGILENGNSHPFLVLIW
jgi:hypothetical protein